MPDSAEATTPMSQRRLKLRKALHRRGIWKVESVESSPHGEASATVDNPTHIAEEVKEEEVDFSVHNEEVTPPDISPEKDAGLHDQAPFDQKGIQRERGAQKAAASAECRGRE